MADCFRAFGLNINSAFDVPGAARISDADPDVTIVGGCAALPQIEESRGIYSVHAGSLLIRLPHADYRCEAGNRIVVQEHDGADRSATEALLAAVALPALLWMRGAIVLHAGAVVLPGHSHALVIAGDSGSGKSTVLRQLLELGARVIADDTAALSCSNQSIAVSGLPAAIWTADYGAVPAAARTLFNVPHSQRCDTTPVGSICVLAARCANESEVTTLAPDRAIEALLQQRHRMRVPRLLRSAQMNLPDLGDIASRTPIFSWRRQQGHPVLQTQELEALRKMTGASRIA